MRWLVLIGPHRVRWRVEQPLTRRERVRGLRDRDGLAPDSAMLFPHCRSVHTFGMKSPIDVVLLDRALRVVAVVPMPPGRLLLPRRRVRHILECAAGVDVCPGDRFIPGANGGSCIDETGGAQDSKGSE